MQYALEARNLSKRFGSLEAVRDVSFSLDHGEVVGFLGPNGAGKSTTMRILTGSLLASSGKAWIDGMPVTSFSPEIRRLYGYLPENNPLPPVLRVREYLEFRGRLRGLSGKGLRRRLGEVMEVCDLQHHQRRIIETLSKGFRQRLGIAEAMIAEPKVLIMDEPTIGLDPHQILSIRDLIAGLKGKMAVLISSHILPEIEISCDRVIIINHGTMVAQGSSLALREQFFPMARFTLHYEGDAADLGKAVKSISPEIRDAENTSRKHLPGEMVGSTAVFEIPRKERDLIRRFLPELQERLRGKTRVLSLHLENPDLEDIFLAATRKSWKETLEITSPAGAEA